MSGLVPRDFRTLAVAALLACGQRGAGPPGAVVDLRGLLPDPATLAGWRVAAGPADYDPATLFEYLDGGAERYLKHGFRTLVQVRYEAVADSRAGVTLDVYDMGSDLGAFGIYSSARPAVADFRDWGVEGYRFGPVAAAWKGRVLAHAEADDELPEQVALLERLVAHVCAALAGPAVRPAILDRLPAEGLVPRSERYEASDLLGHTFLPGGVLAGYEIDGRRAEAFFSDLGSAGAVAAALAELQAHYSQWGEIQPGVPAVGAGGFRFAAPGLGPGSVTGAGQFIAGVYGDLPAETRDRLLARLAARLDDAR
jgi:hypothetical protein